MSRTGAAGLCVAMLLLAACGEKGNIFGFDRSGPDEFSVVRHAPLSLPPDATLRPPQPGTVAAERDRSSEEARTTLVSSGASDGAGPADAGSAGRPSPGELALVNRAAAYYGVEPDIRRLVDEESTRLARRDEAFVNRVLFWQTPAPPGRALDAAAESRRLRENQALGRPLNAGESPLIVRRKSSVTVLH